MLIRFISLVAFIVSVMGASVASAQDYPSKPINVVVSFAAGGNADIMARLEGEALSQQLGVPVNIINKPGGAHIPAVVSVVEAPADGHTLMWWAPPSFVVVPLTRAVPYDPLEDFIPIYAVTAASNALYVRSDSPYQTFEDFIEAAQSKKLKMGVNNLGAPPNLSAVQLAGEFDLEFTTVALKTVPASLTGLIGGQVDVAVGQIASINAFKDDIRPLIILDNDRKDFFETFLPGVRTVGEAFPGKEAGAWVRGGAAVHKDTPPEIVATLVAAAEAGINTPEFEAKIPSGISYDILIGPEEVGKSLRFAHDLYSPILDGLGLLHK